jgi:hypothetical protein
MQCGEYGICKPPVQHRATIFLCHSNKLHSRLFSGRVIFGGRDLLGLSPNSAEAAVLALSAHGGSSFTSAATHVVGVGDYCGFDKYLCLEPKGVLYRFRRLCTSLFVH